MNDNITKYETLINRMPILKIREIPPGKIVDLLKKVDKKETPRAIEKAKSDERIGKLK